MNYDLQIISDAINASNVKQHPTTSLPCLPCGNFLTPSTQANTQVTNHSTTHSLCCFCCIHQFPPASTFWPNSWRPGGASLFWAQQALRSLSKDLIARYGAGAAILYQHGPYAAALQEVAAATDAGAVFYNKRYEPAMMQTDEEVCERLRDQGLLVQGFNAFLLQEPSDVKVSL